jgi:hypothetical protein
MDGTLADKFSNNRRLRLASYDYAVENFPRLIVQLRLGHLIIDTPNSVEIKQVYRLYNQLMTWTILEEDFKICKQIAEKLSIPIFPADTIKDYEDRALAFVKVEFAQRP